MCGIAGLFAYRGDPVDRDELRAAVRRMHPRGPDGAGTWYSQDGRLGLGATRLAIIDLSEEGSQPMTDGDLVIAYNGEIYNHCELRASLERGGARFHSTSDTEVLLKLFRRDGERMTELLRGMYAFAIWDGAARRLFVARDPYGIKPLFVSDDGNTIRIASQVKALLAGGRVSRTRDVAGAAGFFLLGSVPEPFTIYDSIRAVEAGTSFFAGENGIEGKRRHYSIARTFQQADDHRAIARLVSPDRLLCERAAESVEHHLVSDVPVGAFLSGGIDSSTIAMLASRKLREPLRTVTLAFEEFRGTDIDEAPFAERFAREIGADHVTRLVSRDEFRADLPHFFDAMDQPTIDGANTWLVSKAAAEQGLKVALSGIGGDELFGSYPAFAEVPKIARVAAAAARLPMGTRALELATRGKHPKFAAIARYGATYAGAYFIKRGLYLPEDLPAIMGEEAAREGLSRFQLIEHIARALDPDPATAFGRVATLEASLYMRNQLLRDTDWTSMAHSLEVRTPLVDASLLRQIAPLLLEQGAANKQYFGAILPAWLRARRKTGFLLPLKNWLDLPPDGTSTRMRSWANIVLEQF